MNSSAFKRLTVAPLRFDAANVLVAGKAMKIWIEGGIMWKRHGNKQTDPDLHVMIDIFDTAINTSHSNYETNTYNHCSHVNCRWDSICPGNNGNRCGYMGWRVETCILPGRKKELENHNL